VTFSIQLESQVAL